MHATLIESSAGFQVEVCGVVTGEPTRDLKIIARLLTAMGIRRLDLRIDDDLCEIEQLMGLADALRALRLYRQAFASDDPTRVA